MWQSLRRALLVALGHGLLGSSTGAYGQACCGPPSVSLAGTERGVDPATPVNLTVAYSFTRFTRAAKAATTVPDPLNRRALSHLWRVEAEFTILRDWAIVASLPFALKERSFRVDTLSTVYRAAGVGDAMVLLKRALRPSNPLAPWDIAIGIGVKAPTGSSDQERAGVRLPRDLQPGSGTWEALGWGFITAMFPEPLLSHAVSALVRVPLQADVLGYRTGAEVQALLSSSWLDAPLPWLVPSLGVRLRSTSSDRFNGQPLPATGGLWIDVVPSCTLLSSPFAARLQAVLPVFWRTNGIQLMHTWGIAAEVRWSWQP
ncbi:MAG: hypothetical protein ABDH31_06980 [Chlorobiota bacterium]